MINIVKEIVTSKFPKEKEDIIHPYEEQSTSLKDWYNSEKCIVYQYNGFTFGGSTILVMHIYVQSILFWSYLVNP